MRITFTIKPDQEGLDSYYVAYPDLAERDRKGDRHGCWANTLIREALSHWTAEGLIEDDDYESVEVKED